MFWLKLLGWCLLFAVQLYAGFIVLIGAYFVLGTSMIWWAALAGYICGLAFRLQRMQKCADEYLDHE